MAVEVSRQQQWERVENPEQKVLDAYHYLLYRVFKWDSHMKHYGSRIGISLSPWKGQHSPWHPGAKKISYPKVESRQSREWAEPISYKGEKRKKKNLRDILGPNGVIGEVYQIFKE